jgi:hypothetical protein
LNFVNTVASLNFPGGYRIVGPLPRVKDGTDWRTQKKVGLFSHDPQRDQFQCRPLEQVARQILPFLKAAILATLPSGVDVLDRMWCGFAIA